MLSLTAWIDAVTATGALVGLLLKAKFGRRPLILPHYDPERTGTHRFLYAFTWNHCETMNRVLHLCNRRILRGCGKSMLPTLKEYGILWVRTFPKDICLGDVVRAIIHGIPPVVAV